MTSTFLHSGCARSADSRMHTSVCYVRSIGRQASSASQSARSAINALSVCGLPFEYMESSSLTERFAEQQAATAYNALTVCLTELRVDLIRINIWIDPSLATMLIATAQFL